MFQISKREKYFALDLLPNIDLPRVERGGQRFYVTPEGNEYRSVTTVLSSVNKEGIESWRASVGEAEAAKVSQQASVRGTAVHKICEDYVLNSDTFLKGHMPANIATFKQIQPYLDTHVTRVLGNELRMYSDELKTAGTCDLVAEFDGVLTIGDFKTSRKLKKEEWITNYFYQCTAYAIMLHERHGLWCPQFKVMIATDEDTLQVFTKNTNDYVDAVRKLFV